MTPEVLCLGTSDLITVVPKRIAAVCGLRIPLLLDHFPEAYLAFQPVSCCFPYELPFATPYTWIRERKYLQCVVTPEWALASLALALCSLNSCLSCGNRRNI